MSCIADIAFYKRHQTWRIISLNDEHHNCDGIARPTQSDLATIFESDINDSDKVKSIMQMAEEKGLGGLNYQRYYRAKGLVKERLKEQAKRAKNPQCHNVVDDKLGKNGG